MQEEKSRWTKELRQKLNCSAGVLLAVKRLFIFLIWNKINLTVSDADAALHQHITESIEGIANDNDAQGHYADEDTQEFILDYFFQHDH